MNRQAYEAARKNYEDRRGGYEALVERVNQSLDDLNDQRAAALDMLREAAEFLVRAKVKDREFRISDVAAESPTAEGATCGPAHRAIMIGAGALGGGTVGGTVATATFAAAGAFGTASTGTAISGLTGIAAHNATLAFLGGGALAAGGGGMAAGVALLTGVVALPVVAGVGLGWYLTRPRLDEKTGEMDESIARMAAHEVKLRALQDRCREMLIGLRKAEQALKVALRQGRVAEARASWMAYRLYAWLVRFVLQYCRSIIVLLPERLRELLDSTARAPEAALHRVVSTAQALAQLLDAPLQDEEGHGWTAGGGSGVAGSRRGRGLPQGSG